MDNEQPQVPAEPERVTDRLPDPDGSPSEMPEDSWAAKLGVFAVAVASGGLLLLCVPAFVSPVMGSTRSARLRWESRQEEIRHAMAEQQGATDSTAPRKDGPADR